MRKLKRWPVLVALLVGAGALVVGLVYLPRGRVTRENCERVKEGMTEDEVRAILGKPWDNSLLDPEMPSPPLQKKGTLRPLLLADLSGKSSVQYWTGDNVTMTVVFDDNHRVLSGRILSDPEAPRPWLPVLVWRRLRARYGW
jgi:hypothetical protein